MNILSFLNRYLLQKNIYFSHYNKNNFSSLSFKYNILTIFIRKIECVIILIIIFQIRIQLIQLTSKIFHSTHVFQLIITIVMISLILITILFLFKKKLTIIYLLLIYVILIIFYITIINQKNILIKILK